MIKHVVERLTLHSDADVAAEWLACGHSILHFEDDHRVYVED